MLSADSPRPRLRGRDRESDALDRLLQDVRAGASRALVVRGEAGVGKTALLERLADRAAGCRVVWASGVEAEMELAFAGLQLLCAPMLDRLQGLPAPQRDALATAFGLSAGPAPDRFLVGLAVMGLMAEAARGRPLVCVVDDAHWLDDASAQVLTFVARRVVAESVALVGAARGSRALAGVPELILHGLADRDARALLRSAVRAPLDEQVVERIVAETRGNPLALVELPHGLSGAQMAGGFALPDALPLEEHIEQSYRRRLERLSRETRQLLLVAAADPTGDPSLVWRAAAGLGIARDVVAEAEATGLLTLAAPVRFRHPLVRSAVYRAAPPDERQTTHRELANATDAVVDPDRHAWHRAHATIAPDEAVAAELERSAGRAEARGGLAAAAAFLERAAELTPDEAGRARRALAAARLRYGAGAFGEAEALLDRAERGPLSELQRAEVDQLRAQVAFATVRGRDAPPLLLASAQRLEPLDVELARETYIDAFTATLFVGGQAGGERIRALAAAVRRAPQPARWRPRDALLDGLARVVSDGFATGAPRLKQAVRAFHDEMLADQESLRWLWLAGHAAGVLWDFDTWSTFAARQVGLAREAGALNVLPVALSTRAGAHLLAGELERAATLIEELTAISEVTGADFVSYGALALAAFRGDRSDTVEMIESGTARALAHGEGLGLTSNRYAAAVLFNGLGRYDDALAAVAGGAAAHPAELWSAILLPELIEAACRSGRREGLGDAMERLSERSSASGSDWASGIEARCRALLADDADAEALYREAVERLARSSVGMELARAELLYGEWLRRQRRRSDARVRLRDAHDAFAEMGMTAFAERAGRELTAAGGSAPKRALVVGEHLTPQEAQVARLAAEGLSNPEIGARLFISPRTVQYHLRKVFAKLDIRSRTQLHLVLSRGE